MVALSVSTCAITSPADTLAPSSASHATKTPSSIVSLILGISTAIAIVGTGNEGVGKWQIGRDGIGNVLLSSYFPLPSSYM